MFRSALFVGLFLLASGCATPPDVVIEVGDTVGSGEADGATADGSASAPWVAPGAYGRSVVAIRASSRSSWSPGTVVAPGILAGLSSDPFVSELLWRDASGSEGTATVLASDRSTGLVIARDFSITASPLPLAPRTAGASDRIIAHPDFAADRGGWVTFSYERAREICDDRLDNDGDGAVDCSDGACAGWATCLPAWPEDCRDGVDNDDDDEVDCEDSDCRQDLHCDPLCGAGAVLALPDDDGLDGAPMLDACGRVTALVGRPQRRSGLASSCLPSGLTPLDDAAPIAPLTCVSGSRPEVPIVRVRSLLAEAGILPLEDGRCVDDSTVPVALANEIISESVSETTLAMLRRARSMVYAGPGFSAVKVASPPLLVAPTAALPRFSDASDDLVGLDGSTVSLNSAFQRPEPLTSTLSAIFYAIPSSSGFPLASRDDAVADAENYLIGHPDTI